MGPRGGRQPGRARARARDAGVSPVIGMVLILAISVLGIMAVTNWGLPAIREMQTNVQHRSVLDDFHGLDASLQKLIAGTTGQTTYKWQPAITQGSVDVDPTTNRWLVAAAVAHDLNVTYSNASDTDHRFTLNLSRAVDNFKVRAWLWNGGAATELKVNTEDTGCSTYGPVTPSLAAGVVQFYLHNNATSGCGKVNIDNVVLSFAVREEDANGAVKVLHQAFLADVGHVRWRSLEDRIGPRHVFHSNGAIVSGPTDDYLVRSPLALGPPRNFTNATGVASTGIFVRFVKVNGSASFSAAGGAAERYALYLNFVGTYTLGSQENITGVDVYAWGDLREAVYAALKDNAAGYYFKDASSDAVDFLRHREGAKPFRFSAAYSLVKVEA